MSNSEFSLAKTKQEFGLTTLEKRDIFAAVPELPARNLLTEILNYNLGKPIGSGYSIVVQHYFTISFNNIHHVPNFY